MVVSPVSQLVSHYTHHLLLLKPLQHCIVQYYPFVTPKTIQVGVGMGGAQAVIHAVDVLQREVHSIGEFV